MEAIAARVEAIALRLEILETISIGFPYASSLRKGEKGTMACIKPVEAVEFSRIFQLI